MKNLFRKVAVISVALIIGIFGLSSCGKKNTSQNAKNGILIVGADAGSSNQFPENFNINGGSVAAAPG